MCVCVRERESLCGEGRGSLCLWVCVSVCDCVSVLFFILLVCLLLCAFMCVWLGGGGGWRERENKIETETRRENTIQICCLFAGSFFP